MIIVIGEILVDRFPDYERIGGAPFNFAFHLKQMGWQVRLITSVGDDAQGRKISKLLAQHEFDLQDVQIDPHHPTGQVEVTLDAQGIPQFDIRPDVAYDHIDLSDLPGLDMAKAKMIYFGTLAQRTSHGYSQFQAFLKLKQDTALGFCDLNFRPPHLNEAAVRASLHIADILKLNTEELAELGIMCNGPKQTDDLLKWLIRSYGIKLIALTDGSHGSRVITQKENISTTPQSKIKIVDTVGAGDGYGAVIASGILHGWPLKRTLELATEFAATVCTLPGAIPPDRQPYRNLHIQPVNKD